MILSRLPSFATVVQEAVDLPVYAFMTMAEFRFSGLVRRGYYGHM